MPTVSSAITPQQRRPKSARRRVAKKPRRLTPNAIEVSLHFAEARAVCRASHRLDREATFFGGRRARRTHRHTKRIAGGRRLPQRAQSAAANCLWSRVQPQLISARARFGRTPPLAARCIVPNGHRRARVVASASMSHRRPPCHFFPHLWHTPSDFSTCSPAASPLHFFPSAPMRTTKKRALVAAGYGDCHDEGRQKTSARIANICTEFSLQTFLFVL